MDELRRRGDEDARLVWGRWDAACEAKVHRFGRVVFPDCEDASELKALTEAALAAACVPKVCYEVLMFTKKWSE